MQSEGWALSESFNEDDGSRLAHPARSRAGRLPHAEQLDIPTLTQRMHRGDERAFADFHARYYLRIYRYACVLCRGAEQDAAEVAQEALLRVVRYVKKMPSEDVLWSWLTVLIRSAATDHGRRQSRYRSLIERFRLSIGLARAGDGGGEKDLLTLLEQGMDALPDEDRVLIERKYFAGETYRQIAAGLNMSERAIEGRLARAREKLKTWMSYRSPK